VSLEVARELALIVEARLRGDERQRVPGEDQRLRLAHAPLLEVAVRWDAAGGAKDARQVVGADAGEGGQLRERDVAAEVRIEVRLDARRGARTDPLVAMRER
jgi:hypothetical protein